MGDTFKQLRFLATSLFSIFALFFVLQAISSVASIFSATYSFNHALGYTVLVLLISAYGLVLFIPLSYILKMPSAPARPDNVNSPEFEKYISLLCEQYSKNENLRHLKIRNAADLKKALSFLDIKADEKIKATAKITFITTGLSQNGKLDGIIVLISQINLIWQIAKIYNQKPTIKELIKLYKDVFSCAFLSTVIEGTIDSGVDLLINNSTGFASGISAKAAGVVADGATNCLISVRLGVITRRHFNPFDFQDNINIRKGATLEAMALVGVIISEVGSTVFNAAKKTAISTADSIADASINATAVVSEASKNAMAFTSDISKKAANATIDASKQTANALGEAALLTASIIGDSSSKAASATVEVTKKTAHVISESTAKASASISEASSKVATSTIQATKQAGSTITETTSKVASVIGETSSKATDSTIQATKQAANTIGEATTKAATAVSETSAKAASATIDASKQAANTVGAATSKTISSLGGATKKLTNFVKGSVKKTEDPS